MTLKNKYNQTMDKLHLSDTQKDNIIKNVLAKQVVREKKKFNLQPIFASVFVIALVAMLIGPNLFTVQQVNQAPAMDAGGQEITEEAVTYNSVEEESVKEAEPNYTITSHPTDEEDTVVIISETEAYYIKDGYKYEIVLNEPVEDFEGFIKELMDR